VRRNQLSLMKERAVLVDVSIDQGGCFETSRPTTHSDPVYEVDGVTHYCVANMPGAVPVTSTFALALADHGLPGALEVLPCLKRASTSPPARSPTQPWPRAWGTTVNRGPKPRRGAGPTTGARRPLLTDSHGRRSDQPIPFLRGRRLVA